MARTYETVDNGMLVVKSEALAQLARERVSPLLQTAARMVQADWRRIERATGVCDEAMCAYLTLRFERGLRTYEIAQRLGVSRYVLFCSVGRAARDRMYKALVRLDAPFAERWYRQQGGGRSPQPAVQLVPSVA